MRTTFGVLEPTHFIVYNFELMLEGASEAWYATPQFARTLRKSQKRTRNLKRLAWNRGTRKWAQRELRKIARSKTK